MERTKAKKQYTADQLDIILTLEDVIVDYGLRIKDENSEYLIKRYINRRDCIAKALKELRRLYLEEEG